MSNEEIDQRECCKLNFFQSAKQTLVNLVSDPRPVPNAIHKERMDVCNSCEYQRDGKCDLCGCVLVLKCRMNNARCPAQPPKWVEHWAE